MYDYYNCYLGFVLPVYFSGAASDQIGFSKGPKESLWKMLKCISGWMAQIAFLSPNQQPQTALNGV